MDRNEFIKRCKQKLNEVYEEVAGMIVVWREKHPKDALQTLCKEIDPDNWNALRCRVRGLEEQKTSSEGRKTTRDVVARDNLRHGAKYATTEDKAKAVNEMLKDHEVYQQFLEHESTEDIDTPRFALSKHYERCNTYLKSALKILRETNDFSDIDRGFITAHIQRLESLLQLHRVALNVDIVHIDWDEELRKING